jgi:CRP-like cAMP-binding protein
MAIFDKNSSRNGILTKIPADELARLTPHLTHVRWVNGQPLHAPDERIEHVFFVEQGFASTVADADGLEQGVEVGLTGREGLVGLPALFDPEATSFNRVFVQMAGGAYRMPASVLRAVIDNAPTFRMLLYRALQASMAQVAQTAACNSQHNLPERLARWLLLAHDRADGDELLLTQEFLSIMLAVRRSGVTVAIGSLEAAGFIRSRRAHILIADRPGLEDAACDCYRRVTAFEASIAARVQ